MEQLQESCPYKEANCNPINCDCAKYKAYLKVQEPGIIETTLNELGVSNITDSFQLLMTMQKLFASKLHKMDDLTKSEMDHWIDKYLVCIEDEVREAREHLNIYPDEFLKESNSTELKKEIIDILHFVMDVFLVGAADFETIKKYYLKNYAPMMDNVNDLLEFAYEYQEPLFDRKWIRNDDNHINLLTLKLLDASGKIRQQISWKHWKKPSATIDMDELYNTYADLFKCLINLFISLNMDPQEVKNIYVKKNIENHWRQKFNY